MLWLSLWRMTSDDWRKRVAAVNDLANSTDSRAVDALVKALADAKREVRWTSAFALASQGDSRSVPVLKECYDAKPDANITQHAVTMLAQFAKYGNNEASDALKESAARDPNHS